MDTVRFFAANTQPNPVEVDYWVDLYDNPYGGSIKYYNGTEWVRLAASGGIPDLSKYYTKVQVNQLLNDKASVQSVESKVDDEEVKDVIKNIIFRTSNPNEVQMVLAKYDTTTVAISLPKASDVSAGIVTSDDFKDFVKQVDFQQLYQELYDSNSSIMNAINDIKAKYQKKLTAGSNIKISDDNVISATISVEGGDIDIDGINNKIDTLTGKLQEEVTRSTNADNKLTHDLSAESTTARAAEKKNADNIASNTQAIQKEVTDRNVAIKVETDRATAAENKLASDIVTTVETEKDRAEGVEQVIISDLAEEVTRATIAESNKVDKIVGKGLSTNDYTTNEKNKLAGIASGAEVNVQSDWNAVSGDAMILNKPTSLPASDVSDWAKAKTKPSYTAAEVGAVATSSYTANDVLNKLKTVDGSGSGLDADTVRGFTIAKSVPSDAKFTDTTYTFANGADGSFTVTPTGGTAQKVSIGKPAEAVKADNATYATMVRATQSDLNSAMALLYGTTPGSDNFVLRVGNTGNDRGYGEIATEDNGDAPIYVRQYAAGVARHSATLLDSSGNTLFPNTVTANKFVGPLQGTADNTNALTGLTFNKKFFALVNEGYTKTIEDTSNQIWFVKVTVTQLPEYDGFCYIFADSIYDVQASKLIVQLKGFDGLTFQRSYYNSINMVAVGRSKTSNRTPILYLKMRQSTNAALTIKCAYSFTMEKIDAIPDDVEMVSTSIDQYWNYGIKAPSFSGKLIGNSDTATKLATARSINGTNFDGSANITTANWGTARNITIGKTAKSVNGSANVSWSASEIANNATTTTDGWMSKEDKLALANLNSDFYGKEQVTVSVKKDGVAHSVQIDIKNKDNDEVIATSTGNSLTTRIVYGVKYYVSVPDIDKYTISAEILEYTASQQMRTINLEYVKYDEIIIDQTVTDPNTMISGDVNGTILQWIRNNTHRYVAKKTGDGQVTICQLSDNDTTKFHDGLTSSSAYIGSINHDVFVRIPRFWYKATETTTNVWKIGFSNVKQFGSWKEWDGNDLIGAYEGVINGSQLLSISGEPSNGNVSQTDFKAYARTKGTGYTLVKWKHHCIVGVLYYALYGNTNCQATIGSGTNSYSKTTGLTNSLGMNDSSASATGNSSSINFLGLENWWGNKYEFIDNATFNHGGTDYKFYIVEDDGSSREVQAHPRTGTFYPTVMVFGEHLDLVMKPNTTSGTTSTGFCDSQYFSGSSNQVVQRSYNDSGADGGVAYLDTSNSDSDASSGVGSRLAFRGTIIEEKNIETFKAL